MKVVVLMFFASFVNLLAISQTDTSLIVTVGNTTYAGNDKTKEFILNRELAYSKGDTTTLGELVNDINRSKENLFNTSLFNKVITTYSLNDSNVISIVYKLEERWYVWPYPILENGDRNFNTWWETKDFSRLTYGVFLNWYNFRGRNETFQVLAKVGFENQFSIGYKIPNLNKAKTIGIKVATGYSEYREVNYASVENKRIFYKSLSGPGSQLVFVSTDFTYRKSLNTRHTLGIGYNSIKIDSTIQDLTNDYLKNNMPRSDYFSLRYYVKYDTRDYIEYPLKGYKVELYVKQYGLGILQNEGLSLLTTTGGVYWHLPIKGRWYFANSIVGKLSFFDNPPYSLQEGLGYKNAIRGYEFYVMDAQNYGVVKTNLKFAIIKKKEFHVDWVPMKKFSKPYFSLYINSFFDVGFADDALYAQGNPLSNKWAYGYGIGLDITGFYDFVMRLEYSINRENESGFFLHFKKAI